MRHCVVSLTRVRHLVRLGALLGVVLFCCSFVSAATRTWTGSTDTSWTRASNWGGVAPTSLDTANIPGGLARYPTITTSVTVAMVSINTLGSGGSLTVSPGGTLNVTSGLVVNVNGTLTVNGGTVLCVGSLTDNGSVNISSGTIHMASTIGAFPTDLILIGAGDSFTQSGGTVDVLDLSTASGSPNGTYTQTGGTLNIYRDFKNSGAFNASGGTVEFDAAGTFLAFPSPLGPTQFFNVVLNADPKFANNAVSFSVAGNWTANTSVDGSFKSGTVTFNGAGAQTIGGTGNTTFPNLVVNKASGTVSLAANETTNNGSVNIAAGTLDVSTFSLNGAAVTDTLTVANGATLRIGGASNFPTNYSTRSLGATSTVEYYGTNQSVSADTYGHLTLTGSGTKTMPAAPMTIQGNFTMGGTAAATAAAALTINGNCTVGAGTTFGASSFSHSVKGNFANSGTFNAGTGTVSLNGTNAQTVGGANSTTFNSLTINNSSGVTLSGVDATVKTTLTFTSGTITTGANKMIISAGGNVSRTSGYVVGNLQKYFATGGPSSTFEVGSANAYAPINVSFASVSVAGNLIARTTMADHPNFGSSTFNSAKTVNRYWT